MTKYFCGFPALLCVLAVLCSPAMGAPTGLQSSGESQLRGKPSAGFSLASAHVYQVPVGEVKPVTVVLDSQAQQGQVRVTVNTSEAQLKLLSPAVYTWELGDDTTTSMVLELLPHQKGRYYVMLTIELTAEGASPQAQSLGFVVQAGKPARTSAAAKSVAAPAVIPLPVQETIRTDAPAQVGTQK